MAWSDLAHRILKFHPELPLIETWNVATTESDVSELAFQVLAVMPALPGSRRSTRCAAILTEDNYKTRRILFNDALGYFAAKDRRYAK
jgi:hypothetical protein